MRAGMGLSLMVVRTKHMPSNAIKCHQMRQQESISQIKAIVCKFSYILEFKLCVERERVQQFSS
jgi:hypothetical protein